MTTELPKVPIESTRRISSDTVCVRIPCSANFAPGQFVTVGAFIQAAGKEVRRSYSICIRPNGEWIATASGDKTVKIWDATTGRLSLDIRTHTRAVNSVRFSPCGKRIVSGNDRGDAHVWVFEA